MPLFKYEGRSSQGKRINGELEAASVDAVAGQLVVRDITPVKIEEVMPSTQYLKTINELIGANKVFPIDLIMFSRQMYTITKAGIPLTRGIRGLAAGLRHETFNEVLNAVADKLETGMGLARAMRQHPKVFNHLYVSMIEVGESSGKLDQVFKQIGFYIERDEETRKSIRSAIRYPSFVVLALAIAITAINIYVVPAFSAMFEKFDAELPIVTKILIGVSNIFVNYWAFLAILLVAALGFFFHFIQTDKGAREWGKIKLHLPLVGDIIERASMARYSRSFSLMLKAGVPLTQSLNLCAAAIDNPYLSEKILKIKEGVEHGESLLKTHSQAEMFTPLVLQMISVGEESGQVDELLSEIAEFYEREVDYDLKTLTDRIEPVLILTMAIFVTILALGIFLPMWNMYDVQAR